jgi:hypothetical protein
MSGTRLIRPFGQFLQDQRGGKLAAELAEALNTLVEEVMDKRAPGSVKLTIKIKPTKMAGVLEVSDDVQLTVPRAAKDAAMFFADKDFNLVRNDPNQIEAPFIKEIPAYEPRDIEDRDEREVRDLEAQ